MAIAPLPGPVGLYNVSVMPRFLLDSSRVGWQGAYFTEIEGAPAGTVDHGHERYCIQRSLQVEARNRLPGGSWCEVPAGFQADLAQGSPAGPLVGDSLIAAVLAQLAGGNERSPGTLGVSARERSIEYIQCGFADQSQLTRTFARHVGATPGRYRALLGR